MSRRNNGEKSRKRNVITELIELYDIKSAEDIQDALKDLLGETIEDMLASELSEHLGYNEYERSTNTNSRNGKKTKVLRSKYGEIPISVPQDRESTFEPKIVSKRTKDISGIEEKIISMYARGLSTRQISEQIEDIYGFSVGETMVKEYIQQMQ
jgi:transposase-like protein